MNHDEWWMDSACTRFSPRFQVNRDLEPSLNVSFFLASGMALPRNLDLPKNSSICPTTYFLTIHPSGQLVTGDDKERRASPCGLTSLFPQGSCKLLHLLLE